MVDVDGNDVPILLTDNIEAETTYRVRVSAINLFGIGEPSDEALLITQAETTTTDDAAASDSTDTSSADDASSTEETADGADDTSAEADTSSETAEDDSAATNDGARLLEETEAEEGEEEAEPEVTYPYADNDIYFKQTDA